MRPHAFTLNLSEEDGLALYDLFRQGKANVILSIVGDDKHFVFPLGVASAQLRTGRAPDRDYGTTTQIDVGFVQLTPLPGTRQETP